MWIFCRRLPNGPPEAIAAGLSFAKVSTGLSLFSQRIQSCGFRATPLPFLPLTPPAPPLGDIPALPAGSLCPPAGQRQAPGSCQRAQGAEARQGRALSPHRPLPARLWGPVAGAPRTPAARGRDGGVRGGGRPRGLERSAHFKKVLGCASLQRPGNFKAARAAPAAPLRSGASQPGRGA